MNINELRDKEVALLKGKLKTAWQVSRAVWNYRTYLEEIKFCLAREDIIGAAQLWNELDYPVQKLLITAPLYGGPFTTEERAKIKALWEISVNDMEGNHE